MSRLFKSCVIGCTSLAMLLAFTLDAEACRRRHKCRSYRSSCYSSNCNGYSNGCSTGCQTYDGYQHEGQPPAPQSDAAPPAPTADNPPAPST